jgi:hypothetical protein
MEEWARTGQAPIARWSRTRRVPAGPRQQRSGYAASGGANLGAYASKAMRTYAPRSLPATLASQASGSPRTEAAGAEATP